MSLFKVPENLVDRRGRVHRREALSQVESMAAKALHLRQRGNPPSSITQPGNEVHADLFKQGVSASWAGKLPLDTLAMIRRSLTIPSTRSLKCGMSPIGHVHGRKQILRPKRGWRHS